jgi:hypothetical protein
MWSDSERTYLHKWRRNIGFVNTFLSQAKTTPFHSSRFVCKIYSRRTEKKLEMSQQIEFGRKKNSEEHIFFFFWVIVLKKKSKSLGRENVTKFSLQKHNFFLLRQIYKTKMKFPLVSTKFSPISTSMNY